MKRLLLVLLFTPFMLQAQWVQMGIDIDGEATSDTSGFETSLNSQGNIVAIGAYRNDGNGESAGHVRVYENISGTWTQLGSDIDGEAANDNAGISVSINGAGNILALGAPNHAGTMPYSGHVRMMQFDGTDWIQLGNDIEGPGNVSGFGSSVSLSSDGIKVAIGEFGNDFNGNNSGAAWIFAFDGSNWTQVGSPIYGDANNDLFGTSVSLSSNGEIVAIAATENSGLVNGGGQVKVYQDVSGTWTQLGGDIYGSSNNGYAGYSLDISNNGQIVAIGAVNDSESASLSGSVTVYEYDGSNWNIKGAKISGDVTSIQSGYSTSLNGDGSIVAIGDIGTNSYAGRGRIFQFNGTNWTQVGSGIIGEDINDQSGYSISLNEQGSIVAIGAINNDGNGSNSGHVRIFNEPSLSTQDLGLKVFKMYPNPSSEYVTIKFQNILESVSLKVFDVLGKQIKQFEEKGLSQIKIDVRDLHPGIYLVNINSGFTNKTMKLIIE